MKLYIYDHCPFCVKARMIFGLKNVPVELVVMLNDDEETPVRLVGKKWCQFCRSRMAAPCRRAWRLSTTWINRITRR